MTDTESQSISKWNGQKCSWYLHLQHDTMTSNVIMRDFGTIIKKFAMTTKWYVNLQLIKRNCPKLSTNQSNQFEDGAIIHC